VLAEDIPPDCLASFNVKQQKLSANISWILALGTSAPMSCAAGELLRERLFVAGSSMLTEKDLSGGPAIAQQKARAAYDDMEKKIQQLPGEDTAGTLFSALGYLYMKYQLASCILTAEEGGGTCWMAAGKFVAATSKFFQKLYKNETEPLRKQELLTELHDFKPLIANMQLGGADQAGARSRWIRTQTALCRAIQQQCL
jgi:hypothetical protein